MNWHPIETAPKDRPILLYNGSIILGFWNASYGGGCWWECNDPIIGEPTHWMPLPEPPKC